MKKNDRGGKGRNERKERTPKLNYQTPRMKINRIHQKIRSEVVLSSNGSARRKMRYRQVRKKKTSSIEKLEEDSGTIQGKEDSHKIKELTFYKDFNEEGITDEAVIQSVSKFKKLYDNFEFN